MKALRVVGLWVALVLGVASSVMAEGFALTEWSARGLGLASGMVGRADDVSAIAYNAAGITQLPGVQVMGGMALVALVALAFLPMPPRAWVWNSESAVRLMYPR